MFYLPTKEECDYIVKNSKQFFRKDDLIEDKKAYIYHYKQGEYEEFAKFNAWELRGLTFIENQRFLSIHKFFELNQAPGWMYDDLKDKKILKAVEKIDGSLVQPIVIDNKLYFKTKLNFNNYIAKRAKEIITKEQKEYILNMLKSGFIPLFEFISPKTQIVMNYEEEKLLQIQLRDLKTGEYVLDFEKFSPFQTPKSFKPLTLNEFIDLSEKKEDIEGWVLIFEDFKFVKLKTKEYLKRHKLLGKIQEHNIVQKALKKEMNEYFDILNKKSDKYQFVKEVYEIFRKNYYNLKKDIKKAQKMTKKEMRKKYFNHPYYSIIANCKKEGIEKLDELLLEQTRKLKGAKKFLAIE